MKRFLVIIATCHALSAIASTDSVKVVKGQVSDYYIPVVSQYEVSGMVSDEQGMPLEGATVMWLYSPAHSNTDAQGRYSLVATDGDTNLCVHYPGKEMAIVTRQPGQHTVNITMTDKNSGSIAPPRRPAQATRWYDPHNTSSSTYCNPLNISYNYEPWNNNTRQGGSFRSSADPMGLTYKGEYYLFSTNQGGFHYSRNLSDWDFCQASFQRHPADDDECAPAAWVVGDTLFYTGSTYEGLPIWYSTTPKNGRWRRAVERNTLPTWDPYVFLDDDGRRARLRLVRDGAVRVHRFLQPEQHGLRLGDFRRHLRAVSGRDRRQPQADQPADQGIGGLNDEQNKERLQFPARRTFP